MSLVVGSFFSWLPRHAWPAAECVVPVGMAPLARALEGASYHPWGNPAPRDLGYLADHLSTMMPAVPQALAGMSVAGNYPAPDIDLPALPFFAAQSGRSAPDEQDLCALVDRRAQQVIDRTLDAQARDIRAGG